MRYRRPSPSGTLMVVTLLVLFGGAAWGAAVLGPGAAGNVLTKLVDSCAPLHPTQVLLDVTCATGANPQIEGIAIDRLTKTLYVQLSEPFPAVPDTCIFSVSPGGAVGVVNPSTGFLVNERGTDLHYDQTTGLLVTKDEAPGLAGAPERIVTVNPVGGAIGVYTLLPPAGTFTDTTFGMDFSRGAGGTDVPAKQIVFTADRGGSGIHSSPPGGPYATHLVPPTAGDDVVVQPDGDWVHVPDFMGAITAYSPAPGHLAAPSLLDIQTIFGGAGLGFVFGSRATVCDANGEIYISFSGGAGAPIGGNGGSGIFAIDEPLLATTHLVTMTAWPNEGVQDLVAGPSSAGFGGSLYFTVHDNAANCEQVWELTLPECDVPLYVTLESFTAEVVPEGVLLEWTTATERDNAGFRVLREREGVRQKHPTVMTPTPIPAQGDNLQGATYRWLDTSPQRPGTVLYWLEDIDLHGRVDRHGPVKVEIEREPDPGHEERYREAPGNRIGRTTR